LNSPQFDDELRLAKHCGSSVGEENERNSDVSAATNAGDTELFDASATSRRAAMIVLEQFAQRSRHLISLLAFVGGTAIE
jgi:hypothetical protein